jgi:hypothetical protein
MGAATCVTERAGIRLGVMVRTAAELWVYWHNADVQALRVVDVTGRTPSESLDGTGERVVAPAAGATSVYVAGVLPGHLYVVELLHGDEVLLSAGPVQTPWLSAADDSSFPAPYHRS